MPSPRQLFERNSIGKFSKFKKLQGMNKIVEIIANSQSYAIHLTRISIFIVMAWIGGLKVYQYEADGIVPFVANSPFMSFFYSKDAPEYQEYKNPEGKTVQKNIDWHQDNGTYLFAYGLGAVIVLIGALTLLGIWYPKIGFVGGLLTFGMSLVTLSFLITTPEVYVPNLGGDFPTPQYGFPYLSGAGRLVLKDVIMLGAGLICASDNAKQLLQKPVQ
ncbi:MAG: YkgB family protein [Saprospiraceae bacterium]|nr:YkgB family protein [Saprospiraceae bacterium]